MYYPFNNLYDDKDDKNLIKSALQGSEEALVNLIEKHQNYIYNIAFKMVLSPYDAEDITQEVIIKIITKLEQFNNRSSFKTWIYRITLNHFLSMKKKWLEQRYENFSSYQIELDSIESNELSEIEKLEMKELIEEARLGCMSGMLLCLSREQRIVFILGEIFSVPHDVGAKLMEISKENFRQRLSRARNDLYQFMNQKCGLVNKKNPCRCSAKTKSFIKAGWVDSETLKFNTHYTKKISDILVKKDSELKKLEFYEYKQLQQKHPFQEKEFIINILDKLLHSSSLKETFNLSRGDINDKP